jgi:hypothetical protein
MQKLNTDVSNYNNEWTSVLDEGVFLDQWNNWPSETSTKCQRKETKRKEGNTLAVKQSEKQWMNYDLTNVPAVVFLKGYRYENSLWCECEKETIY